ncbi:MAG: peptidase M3 [Bacteroidetes bacterium GWF2_49_14]|nr:MAG: peptidase M3 [Bacteroidetes bacterium GWF2_49_14]
MKNLLLLITALCLLASCKPAADKKAADNPLVAEFTAPFGVPPFEQIKPHHYMPAFKLGMEEQLKEVDAIANSKKEPTFANTIIALDESGELLSKVSRVFFSLAEANTSDSLQQIQMEISPLLSAHGDAIDLNPKLFERIKSVYENQGKFNLKPDEVYILENIYKGLVRNGANLDPEKKEQLKKLNEELSVLTVQFDQNVLAETNGFKLVIDNKEDLAGLPESVISAAAEAAKAAGLEGKWVFGPTRPSMTPFLQYAENRDLRKKLYDGYLSRGNNPNDKNNNDILAKIISLRTIRAQLLGYSSHSAIVLEPRMAKTPENVLTLLDKIWAAAIPAAVKDRDEMQQIISREGGKFNLEPGDWLYYAEKLRKEKYDLDENELRPYFKVENVRDGAFDVANKLYGITFTEITDIPKPHAEAMAYEVKEADGSHIGILYMDLFPRPSKQQGAWCGAYREHCFKQGREITPVVTMVGNFTRPTGNTPALISLDEALTHFHEFGHALEGLFAENRLSTTFIAWDFVELPSQIMEHWATEPEVLKSYARHYQTGEPIPDALIEKMKKSSYFNQGFTSTEFLAACYLDIAFHSRTDTTRLNIGAFEKEYLTGKGLIPEIYPRYRSTYFIHITGGYDSGYYSYEWAAVLDNDAFEAFKEKGLFDKATAKSLRDNILSKDGTMDPMQMFINFRGRQPDITPLMKNRGFLD